MSATKQISKEEAVRQMVDWHFQLEPEILEIYRFITPDEDAPDSPIRLLDVSDATFETGRVDVFGFPSAGEIPYRSLLATVTPGEMERIRTGEIPLPKNWDLKTAHRFVRSGEEIHAR